MHDGLRFAKLPRPPYYAVIFSSQRTSDDEDGYAATAQRMVELVQQQPGYLGHESARDAGFGITVAYFESEAAIAAWRDNAEHAAARREGHRHWYEHLELRIAKVERAYGGVRRDADPVGAASAATDRSAQVGAESPAKE